MRKTIHTTIVIVLISYCNIFAQVGVGNTNPRASLDITATNQVTPINTDGILIPRVDLFPATNPTVNQHSMLVYLTTTVGTNVPGFYYWNNPTTTWLPLNTALEKIDDLLDGKSDNDGSNNGSSVFLGLDAGANDDSSDNRNVGIGYQALNSNDGGLAGGFPRGHENVATGYQALYSNISGFQNVANGYQALYSNIGVIGGTNGGYQNVATGYQALYSNTGGLQNVANGYRALYSNTTGRFNVAVGQRSLRSNTTGRGNTAIGFQSLRANTTGRNNTASGENALRRNTEGVHNTATGLNALFQNISGEDNTATGSGALRFNLASENTANGYQSLRSNSTGTRNTAIGTLALWSNNTGNNNTAVGYSALFAGGTYSNSTALGANTVITASSQIRLGNSAVGSIGGYDGWTTLPSDSRFKTNVKENVIGIEFIKRLRPVTYNLDMDAIAHFNKTPNESRSKEEERLKAAELQIGFIAQEVEAAANELGFDFHGVDKPKNSASGYGIRYAEFVAPLVKAVQEQQIIIENSKLKVQNYETRIEKLENENIALKNRLDRIERMLKE